MFVATREGNNKTVALIPGSQIGRHLKSLGESSFPVYVEGLSSGIGLAPHEEPIIRMRQVRKHR